MAESTRSKANSDLLEDAITKLTISLNDTLHSLTHKIDELINHLQKPEPNSHSPLSSSAIPSSATPPSSHRMKLDVPRFDGADLLGWIFKINQFLEYHATPEHERLTIVSFYMDGRALSLFQWMTSNGQFTSWPAFLQALFEFEDLANRIVGMPSPFLLSCFVSGLSSEIRREVQALQPLTMEVIGDLKLTKL